MMVACYKNANITFIYIYILKKGGQRVIGRLPNGGETLTVFCLCFWVCVLFIDG